MTAAEIVPYKSPNADLVAEVERLRHQVAELEGAEGPYPDHHYDRQSRKASSINSVSFRLLWCKMRLLSFINDSMRTAWLYRSEYFDGDPTPDHLEMQEDRTLEYTNGDKYQV